MSVTKTSALDFPFFDDETVPLNESTSVTPIRLEPTSAIIVIGYIPSHSTRFAINLVCRTSGNIALHFNPRLDRGYVVRNSKVKGQWSDEETCSPVFSVSESFRRDSYFHLVIFCSPKEFQIAVNGEHFCTFPYRLPLDSIASFEYTGEVEDVRIRKTTLWIYPDPKIVKSMRNLKISNGELISDNLKVPLSISIASEIQTGTKLFVKGRLKLLPYSFTLNLQKSNLIYPHPEIALHLNPRFHYGNRPACVVMNYWSAGCWGPEERHEGQLSWGPGRKFLLMIRCESESFAIWLGNKMIGEFKHRLQPSIIDTLQISGDVVLHEIALSLG